jgi:regulatory protein
MRDEFIKKIKLKAAGYCAYRERTQQEVRDKLYQYGLHRDEVEALIAELISENFISEERYAIAFAGGKFRMKKWGRVKIINELKRRGITDYCINKALTEIDADEYEITAKNLAVKKFNALTDTDPLKKKYKVMRYLTGKGYEYGLVQKIADELYSF